MFRLPWLPATPPTALATAVAAAALSACGGGGGDGPNTSPAGSGGSTPGTGTGTSPGTPPQPAAPPTETEAARFLAQAGFAASAADITRVQSLGYAGWLDQQFAMERSQSHFDWMLARGYGAESYKYNYAGVDASLWRKLIGSPDQLRQRVVLALSEIFVVSPSGLNISWGTFGVANHVDLMEQHAFGSFRALLEAMTLSNAMGSYLSMRGNRKEDTRTGRQPDENFAREVMQLFTIGLVQLNLDGTPKLVGGKPAETYTLAQITALARVFTGWDFESTSVTDPAYMRRPMVHNASSFSSGAKKVLDVDIPAGADGPAALKTALDTLANHPNVGPFIGRQLIQRLVCSQPSPAYVQRVAQVFNDNGQGQRGDLRAVVRAILLDTEARQPATGPSGGKLREPVQRLAQWARTVGMGSPGDLWGLGDTSSPVSRLGQSPLRSPSVFNFFRPGYVPPGAEMATSGITAPEFQLCNETSVAGYLNFMQTLVNGGMGDMKPDYTADLALASDASALVRRQALLMGGGAITDATVAQIATAVGSIAATSDAGKLNRVKASWLLVLACPEYQIQK